MSEEPSPDPATHWPSPPPRPRSTGSSARPQSHRFLRETLTKLSDDSIRIGRRLLADESSRSPSPALREHSPLTLPEQAAALSALSSLRPGSALRPGPDIKEQALDRGPYEVRDAMLAVSNIISIWEQDVSKAADNWARHIDVQVERHSANNERWDDVMGKLAELQDRLDAIDKRICHQSTTASDFEAAQREANSCAETSLHKIAAAVSEAAQASASQSESSRRAVVTEIDTVKVRFKQLLYEEADGRQSISSQLIVALQKLDDLARVAQEDVAQWKTSSDRWFQASEEGTSKVKVEEGKLARAQADIARLQTEAGEFSGQISTLRRELAKAADLPGTAAFSSVKAIEKRGRLRVDRQTGKMEVLKGLEFASCKPSAQPVVSFKDAEVAAAALGDVSEIWGMFSGPVDIDVRLRPGKGGKPEFWDKLAVLQAMALKEALEKAGVPEINITTQGSQAIKGTEPGIIVTLKRDVFSDALAAAPPAADKKSPRTK